MEVMRMRWKHGALALWIVTMLFALSACGGKLPAGVTSGLGDLGGMKPEEAAAQLESAFATAVEQQSLRLNYNGDSVELPGTAFQLKDVSGQLTQAEKGQRIELAVELTQEGEQSLQRALEELARADTVMDTICTVDGDSLLVTKGTSGVSVAEGDGLAAAKAAVLDFVNQAVNGGSGLDAGLELSGTRVEPAMPDLEGLYSEIYTEPVNAALDPEAGEIIPHEDGISFDIAAVRSTIEGMAEGATRSIPLTVTEPEITTAKLEANLFKDVLGQASSKVGGTAARLSNVTLAASMCNEKILMPGDVFAYNETTGPRTLAAGFKNAPAYVNGKTEDQVGGGICQVSSTTYYAVLLANLKVVERQNHSYAVGYVPDGMDATVFYGSLDFRFENDTKYPIKLVYTVVDRTLTVKILGTNESGYTYKVWNKVLSTTPPETIEQEDPTLQPGESRVEQTAYTGKKVEVYRETYDKDGNLLSTDKVNTSTYKKRDKIVLVGPKTEETVNPTTPAESTPATQTPVTEQPSTPPAEVTPPVVTTSPEPEVPTPIQTVPPVITEPEPDIPEPPPAP